jgi:hypothetical protein
VTVFHTDFGVGVKFTPINYGTKYGFMYLWNWPDAQGGIYPAGEQFNYGELLTHLFLHGKGASDKAYAGPEQACLTDPALGIQYEARDIMCHRVYDRTHGSTLGYNFQPLPLLVVSKPTAVEVGWLP